MLPREQLLKGSQHSAALAPLLDRAEQALRTWEPVWTGFVAADLREEAEQRLGELSELSLSSDGGWPDAERRCLLLRRQELVGAGEGPTPAALQGLVISGNFLFDPAEPGDLRAALLAAGAEADELGDIWLRGDRGGQAVLLPAAAVFGSRSPGWWPVGLALALALAWLAGWWALREVVRRPVMVTLRQAAE